MVQQRLTFPTVLILFLLSYIRQSTVRALSSTPPPSSTPSPKLKHTADHTPFTAAIESNNPNERTVVTRRSILHHTLRWTTSAALVSAAFTAPAITTTATGTPTPPKAYAKVSQPTATEDRQTLLQAIRSSRTDDEVLQAIQQLLSAQPTPRSTPSTSTLENDLDGEWKLLWSIGAESFSPLLQLPKPLKPESYQYFGRSAALEVGDNRVAQGLTGGILGSHQLWLSSGVLPLPPNDGDPGRVLEIQPPFRLQWGGRYGTSEPKVTVVEAGSDAEFRRVNARTVQAQNAPKNRYKQLYWEGEGEGSLRISTITEGDPVIVGAVFVHEKL